VVAIEKYTEHLALWDVNFRKTPWTMGTSLAFDPKAEKYVGKGSLVEKANSMLRDNYRKPFVVPEKV
jgi:hypothetical protein